MQLSSNYIQQQAPEFAPVIERIRRMPEKVLQFGTGVLLRGLPDYYIDKANRQGIFNGRIVVIKSTGKGSADDFEKQDNLYTQCIRGYENDLPVSKNIINASISRVLNANSQWKEVLDCAKNKELQVIISNTTEMGIELVKENIFQEPPVSFPAKLLAFLYERFRYFGSAQESESEHKSESSQESESPRRSESSPDFGMVIIPTELIPGNGNKLRSIVLELAEFNKLEEEFIKWLNYSNRFCNSLVDRIVPGKPSEEKLKEYNSELGYEDSLLIVSEPYSLWAIEGDDLVKQQLSFHEADLTVIIEEDIEKYRELKLRLLNGTHTLSCAVSILMELELVHESMKDELVKNFVDKLMKEEIGKAIPAEVGEKVILSFTNQVINRFRNPHINHKWMSISFQYTSKMVLRNIPLLYEWYKRYQSVPKFITMGFAAYLYFMRPYKKADLYYGNFNGREYLIEDVFAESFAKKWEGVLSGNSGYTIDNGKGERKLMDRDSGNPGIDDSSALRDVIKNILGDVSIWGSDLNQLPGFYKAVLQDLNHIQLKGMRSALTTLLNLQVI